MAGILSGPVRARLIRTFTSTLPGIAIVTVGIQFSCQPPIFFLSTTSTSYDIPTSRFHSMVAVKPPGTGLLNSSTMKICRNSLKVARANTWDDAWAGGGAGGGSAEARAEAWDAAGGRTHGMTRGRPAANRQLRTAADARAVRGGWPAEDCICQPRPPVCERRNAGSLRALASCWRASTDE